METIHTFVIWLLRHTRLMLCFVIAVILHAVLVAVLGSMKIAVHRPRIVASFDAGSLPPSAIEHETADPNAAYRDFEYTGRTLGGGGGTDGKGPGGVPTAGGGTPESYDAHILSFSAQTGRQNGPEIIGIISDGAGAIARLAGSPTGVGLPSLGGLGETAVGTSGIQGPGGGILGARMGPQRAINLDKYDGSAETEKAVMAALRWLKSNQQANGSWKCGKSAVAGTALATLAFLGHGETPDSAEFGQAVSKGLEYLVLHVGGDGLVADTPQDYISGNSQGLVVVALAEGFAATQSPALREPLDRAVRAIIRGQSAAKANPQHVGGWRYSPSSDDSDVSVTGWMIMALTSTKAAGVDVPQDTRDKAAQFLWNMYDTKAPGFGYQSPERNPSMTAVGVLCQELLGNGADPRIKAALDYLREQKVEWNKTQGDYILYGWYYITQAMFQGGVPYWPHWNGEIRDTMIKHQQPDGRWVPPPNSTIEIRDLAATPAYSTALGALILEVYYRYLPVDLLVSPSEGGITTSTPKTETEAAHE